jgi:hypothetical protein
MCPAIQTFRFSICLQLMAASTHWRTAHTPCSHSTQEGQLGRPDRQGLWTFAATASPVDGFACPFTSNLSEGIGQTEVTAHPAMCGDL